MQSINYFQAKASSELASIKTSDNAATPTSTIKTKTTESFVDPSLEFGSQIARLVREVSLDTYDDMSEMFQEIVPRDHPYMPLYKYMCTLPSKYVRKNYKHCWALRDYLCGKMDEKCPICYMPSQVLYSHIKTCH